MTGLSFSPSRLRRIGHGLLGALLLLGAMDLHPAEEAHHSLAPSGGSVYFPEAAHPGQPVHFEAVADPVEQPHCDVCLHSHKTRAEPPRLVAAAAPFAGESGLWLAPASRAGRGSRRPDGARAPPFLS